MLLLLLLLFEGGIRTNTQDQLTPLLLNSMHGSARTKRKFRETSPV